MTEQSDFQRINAERDEAERASWREYRDALQDYNEALSAAYKKHHDNLERIELEWRAKLEAVA